MVVTENTGALGCYLRCGFKITGVEEATIRWDGRFYDELLMVRWLESPPVKPNTEHSPLNTQCIEC
jgi:RimJ/RimL family protein N-acetyltransferase